MKKGEDYTGVSVIYFCHDGEGNYLMHKRSNQCRDEHGKWDCGGGGLDFGDSVESTLRKEIKEEYCTNVLDYEFLGYKDIHRKNGEYKTHWVALYFKVLVDKESVQNGEPHKFTDLQWFPMNNLPSPLHSQLPHDIELYKDRL